MNFKNKKFYRLVNDPIVNVGTIGNRMAMDSEALAKADPDVYICRTTDKADIDLCARLGIPSIAITAEVPEEVFEAYELLGKVLGCEERAEEVTGYLKNELKDIDTLAATIPEESRREDRGGRHPGRPGPLLGGLRRREDLRVGPGLHLRHQFRRPQLLDGRLLQRLRLGRHDCGQEQTHLQNAGEARLLGHARTRLHSGDVLHDAPNVPRRLHDRNAAERGRRLL